MSAVAYILLEAVMDALVAGHNAGALARGVQCSLSALSLPMLSALEKLAHLGSHGRLPNHCHRDLVSLLALPKLELSYFRMKLTCGPRNSRSDWFTQAFLLPHLVLASLYIGPIRISKPMYLYNADLYIVRRPGLTYGPIGYVSGAGVFV